MNNSIIASEVYENGLNTSLSLLYEPGYSNISLSFDIAELFRPLLVDRLIFFLINKKIIDESDIDNNGQLSDIAIKKIFYHWDRHINTMIYHRSLKRKVTYQYLIKEEMYKIIRCLENGINYSGFVIWW